MSFTGMPEGVVDMARIEEAFPGFFALREAGLELLQQKAGDQWTDYNLHDPGVTILEQLCYAITDLAYRTSFPIKDLLADHKGEIARETNSFFQKRWVLCSRAATINDYRKVLLDEVAGLDNIWIDPVLPAAGSNVSGYPVKGMYRFYLQVKRELAARFFNDTGTGSETEQAELKDSVRKAFVKHRNFCEDALPEMLILEPVNVTVKADIAIKSGFQPEIVLAEIVHMIERSLSPQVKRYTEQELIDRNYPIEKIYNGPFLSNGFIRDEDLVNENVIASETASHAKVVLDPSDLVKNISGIPGIASVLKLSINDTLLPVELGGLTFPLLDLDTSIPHIQVYLDNYKISVPYSAFRGHLENIRDKYRKNRVEYKKDKKPEPVPGKFRDSSRYYSIQNNFPVVYGLGIEGIPGLRTPLRMAQVKQLKAYLMFFEQLMADYLAQLAGISSFFSNQVADDNGSTYFSQPLNTVPDAIDILAPEKGAATWEEMFADRDSPYLNALKHLPESRGTYYRRKEKMLDHMLARFNELLVSYPVKLFSTVYNDKAANAEGLILQWKSGVLRNISRQGYNRCAPADYLSTGPLKAGDYNFQKRMYELLYIQGDPGKPLTAAVTEAAGLSDGQVFPAGAQSQDEGKAERHVFNFGSQDISLLWHALDKDNFRLADPGDGHQRAGLHFKGPLDSEWQEIGVFDGAKEAAEGLNWLIGYFRNVNIRSEGFYLVENMLLRPRGGSADEISTATDLSFVLSVVLPSWPARFRDPDFPGFVQSLFKLNAPAHLKLRYYWLGIDEMLLFEPLYFGFKAALKDGSIEAGKGRPAEELLAFLQSTPYTL